jgi:hypothetical protein
MKEKACIPQEVPIISELKDDAPEMRKSGIVRNGKTLKSDSSESIRHVAVVEVRVKFPIIPDLKNTESPVTSVYRAQSLCATSVIEVSIPDGSSVQCAERL